MTEGGGAVASTAWGMKLRFSEREACSIQASMCGWMSERRKGMGFVPVAARLRFTDFSMKGVGPRSAVPIRNVMRGGRSLSRRWIASAGVPCCPLRVLRSRVHALRRDAASSLKQYTARETGHQAHGLGHI